MAYGQNHGHLHLERIKEWQLLLGAVPDWIDADRVYAVFVDALPCFSVVAGLEQIERQGHEVVIHEATVDGEEGHEEEHVAEFVGISEALDPRGQAPSKHHEQNGNE